MIARECADSTGRKIEQVKQEVTRKFKDMLMNLSSNHAVTDVRSHSGDSLFSTSVTEFKNFKASGKLISK